MFYFEILKAFFDARVRYLIIGGTAVNLHGIPRITNDLDVIISFDPENIKKVKYVMLKLGYIPSLPGVSPDDLGNKVVLDDWIKNRNLKTFSYIQPSSAYKKFDILLEHPIDFDEAYKRKTQTSAQEVTIDVISINDLIEMKKFSGRKQDISDIENLEKLND